MPENPRPYTVTQSGRSEPEAFVPNAGVSDLESLFTHHPKRNYHASLVEGMPTKAENSVTRAYGLVGGEFQELMVERVDKSRAVVSDQVLLIKDFILDDMASANTRRVDVPSPVAGVIGRVDAPNGVVDICEPDDGRLVARIRHLGPIAVEVGDTVAYGQSLGTQNNIGLRATAGKHVHIEMDTRHYQQFDDYIRDLVDGRLPVQAAHRVGVTPRAIVDDGVQRVGEAGERVAAVQRALVAGGYRGVGDAPIVVDGIYRLSMQGAVLAFQQDHGLAASGDIDAATWHAALDLTPGKPVLPPAVFDDASPASHPSGHERLLERIRGHVGALDGAHGHLSDGEGERLAHALLRLATEQQLESVDQVVLGAAPPDAAAGERVFVVQGRLDDPGHRRAWMPSVEAIATPVAESMARVREIQVRKDAPMQPMQIGEQAPEQQWMHRGS